MSIQLVFGWPDKQLIQCEISAYTWWDFRMWISVYTAWDFRILTGFSTKKLRTAVSPAQLHSLGGQWRGDRIVKVTVIKAEQSNVTEIKHFPHQICSVFRPASSTNCESQWIFFIQLFRDSMWSFYSCYAGPGEKAVWSLNWFTFGSHRDLNSEK